MSKCHGGASNPPNTPVPASLPVTGHRKTKKDVTQNSKIPIGRKIFRLVSVVVFV